MLPRIALVGLVCALAVPAVSEEPEDAGETYYAASRAQPACPAVKHAGPLLGESGEESRAQTARELVAVVMNPLLPCEPEAEAAREISGLVKDLGSDDFARREAASRALFRRGQAAMGALEAAVADRDPEVEQRAADALAVIRQAAAERALAGVRPDSWDEAADAAAKRLLHELLLVRSEVNGEVAERLREVGAEEEAATKVESQSPPACYSLRLSAGAKRSSAKLRREVLEALLAEMAAFQAVSDSNAGEAGPIDGGVRCVRRVRFCD